MIKFVKNNNRIKFKCLIISTIFITSGLLFSCAAPRSVRPTSNYLTSKKHYVVKPINEKDNKQQNNHQKNYTIDQAQSNNQTKQNKAIAGLNNTNLDNNGLPIKKTPTLNTQMKLLYESNLKMQKDIEIIKNSINQINQQIDNLDNQNNQKQTPAQQSIRNIPQQNNKMNNNTSPKGDGIILSDEDNQKIEKINFDDKFANPSPIRFKPNRKTKPKKRSSKKYKESSQLTPIETKNKTKDDIKNVQSIINSKNYQAAIQKLNNLINKTKDPIKITVCNFYLGESHYGLKQYDKAIDYFRKVLQNGNTDKNDDAQFSIAEAFYKLGNIKEAKREYKIFVRNYPKSEKIPDARKILQQI